LALPAAAMPIIWVAFGGRQDLTATAVGTFAILAIFQAITIYSQQYALILMGLLLLVTVLFVPAGYVMVLARLGSLAARRLRRGGRGRAPGPPPRVAGAAPATRGAE
jgi:urea transport system permease protein